mgnify:CR=1 FL=1
MNYLKIYNDHLETFARIAAEFEQHANDLQLFGIDNSNAQALIDCNSEFLRSEHEKKLMTGI